MNQDSAAFLRAVKGPVLMITVGVLFALDNFTPFSFHRTWPILIVVVGILSLGRQRSWHGRSRFQAQWGPPQRPMPPIPPFPFGGPAASSSWQARPTSPSSAPVGAKGRATTAAPGTYRGSTYQTSGNGNVGGAGTGDRQKQARKPDVGSTP